MIMSIVHYLHEFSLEFIEQRFCPSRVSLISFWAWNWFSKIFWHFSKVKSTNIPFPFIGFISLSGNVLTFKSIWNCSFSFFSLLESSKSSCSFSSGSGSWRITVSVSMGFSLVMVGRSMVTFPYFLDNWASPWSWYCCLCFSPMARQMKKNFFV